MSQEPPRLVQVGDSEDMDHFMYCDECGAVFHVNGIRSRRQCPVCGVTWDVDS